MIATEAVSLANMCGQGQRNILVYCGNAPRCWRQAKINADRWPDDATFVELAPRFVCTACGAVGAEIRPDWSEITSGSASGASGWMMPPAAKVKTPNV